jgi:hypothetical protein
VAVLKFICLEERLAFWLSVIPDANLLFPTVFLNSHKNKMHDSLPLELFSLKTTGHILHLGVVCETMIVSWYLLVTAFPLRDLSTKAQTDLMRIRF